MKKEYIIPTISFINVNYEDVILASLASDLKANETLDLNTSVNGETWGK